MRSKKRNWILRRMVLGFAVAALAGPAAAQARVDEGISGQPNSAKEAVVDYGAIETARLQPRSAVKTDIELVRLNPRGTLRSSDLIEQVRVAPKGGTAQVVSSPGFNWGDAGIGAILALALLGLGVAGYRATRHLGKPQTA
jgi:hypothetical protein